MYKISVNTGAHIQQITGGGGGGGGSDDLGPTFLYSTTSGIGTGFNLGRLLMLPRGAISGTESTNLDEKNAPASIPDICGLWTKQLS